MSSQQLRITLAGREHVVEAATTAGAALSSAASDGSASRRVIAARVADAVAEIITTVRDRVQV